MAFSSERQRRKVMAIVRGGQQTLDKAYHVGGFREEVAAIYEEVTMLEEQVARRAAKRMEANRIWGVLDIIKELENERGIAPQDEVVRRAREKGLTPRDVREKITRLRADGHIYDPRRDSRFKVV